MPKAPQKPAAAAKRVVPKAKPTPKVAIKPPALPKKRAGRGGSLIGTDEYGDRVYTRMTPTVMDAFFHCLSRNGNVTLTCNELNLNRIEVYHHKKNPEFLARFNTAMSLGIDSWEDEAVRRAFDGYLKPVFQQGMQVGEIREYSDTLAAMILKGGKPERYNPVTTTNLNMSGAVDLGLSALTDEELDEKINAKLRHLGSLPP